MEADFEFDAPADPGDLLPGILSARDRGAEPACAPCQMGREGAASPTGHFQQEGACAA